MSLIMKKKAGGGELQMPGTCSFAQANILIVAVRCFNLALIQSFSE